MYFPWLNLLQDLFSFSAHGSWLCPLEERRGRAEGEWWGAKQSLLRVQSSRRGRGLETLTIWYLNLGCFMGSLMWAILIRLTLHVPVIYLPGGCSSERGGGLLPRWCFCSLWDQGGGGPTALRCTLQPQATKSSTLFKYSTGYSAGPWAWVKTPKTIPFHYFKYML